MSRSDALRLLLACTSARGWGLWSIAVDRTGVPDARSGFGTGGSDWAPRWSPDGTKFLFTSDRTGNPDVFVASAAGSNPVNLTSSDPNVDEYAAWSPDGSTIAFDSDRADPGGATDIYTMNTDGSNVFRLAYDAAGAILPSWRPPSVSAAPHAVTPPHDQQRVAGGADAGGRDQRHVARELSTDIHVSVVDLLLGDDDPACRLQADRGCDILRVPTARCG